MRAPGKRTLHRRLAAGIIVVILVAAAAWYTRPVDLYALSPDLEAPQDLTCLLLRYTGNLAEDTTRTLDLTAEDGEAYRQVLSQLEALRFRRFPLGELLQSLRDGQSRVITPGDFDASYQLGDGTCYVLLQCRMGWWEPSHMTLTAFASGPFPSAAARRPPRRSMNPSGSWPSR
ncbi:MAG: hypothetical protein V8R55_03855 [Dysosmobacter sp.]